MGAGSLLHVARSAQLSHLDAAPSWGVSVSSCTYRAAETLRWHCVGGPPPWIDTEVLFQRLKAYAASGKPQPLATGALVRSPSPHRYSAPPGSLLDAGAPHRPRAQTSAPESPSAP